MVKVEEKKCKSGNRKFLISKGSKEKVTMVLFRRDTHVHTMYDRNLDFLGAYRSAFIFIVPDHLELSCLQSVVVSKI